MRIWYLTRSYYPYQKGGGPLTRTSAVKYLQELAWDLTVVMPNYGSNELNIEDNIIQIALKHIQKLSSLLERVGIYEDYLDHWIKQAFDYLKDKVKNDDILFATSGGELGMIKLGFLLKNKIGCKFVVNFHDPLNYGYMNGLRRDKKPHIGREIAHEKYIKNADLILTSSEYYAEVLRNRFSYLSDKIHNNYFGYINNINLNKYKKENSEKLRIAYVGSMGKTQRPELFYQAYRILQDANIELFFIGDVKNYAPLKKIMDDNVYFIDYLPHDEFLNFMIEKIDIGLVSLANDYFAACVPSKIYEYINLGLPMIGALPDGDGKDIINNHQYGLACNYNNVNKIADMMKRYKDKKFLESTQQIIIKDKQLWDMKNKMLEVNSLLKSI